MRPGDDTTKAGWPFAFTVNARSRGFGHADPLRDLKVWTSAAGGVNWTRAAVIRGTGSTNWVWTVNPVAPTW